MTENPPASLAEGGEQDLISRKAAIEAMKKCERVAYGRDNELWRNAANIISALPLAAPSRAPEPLSVTFRCAKCGTVAPGIISVAPSAPTGLTRAKIEELARAIVVRWQFASTEPNMGNCTSFDEGLKVGTMMLTDAILAAVPLREESK
jgi:hypothetical protein